MALTRRQVCASAVAGLAAGMLPGGFVTAAGRRRLPGTLAVSRLDGTAGSLEGAAVVELAASVSGPLLVRGDFGYDGARRIWNGMHDRYPALIVRAQSAADAALAVDFARDHGLLLAVRGGGHSWSGQSVADGALMLDLSLQRGVSIDPARRRARVGGGALLYDLDFAALRHDLVAPAGIVSHTGIGGLTLGGGYGRLSRAFGLTIDSLVAATIVTADGQVRRIDAEDNADLFWAIRGGGGNFGVVTEFEFELHPVSPYMYGGIITWPIASARDVLDYHAEHAARLPHSLFLAPGVSTAPSGDAVLNMEVCYAGTAADAERVLAPLRAVAKPLVDGAVPVSYLTLQTRNDGVAMPGIRSYIKSGMVAAFTPGLIESLVEGFEPGQGAYVNSFATGGRIAEVDETATAWPHRRALAMVAAVAFWPDAAQDDARIQAVRKLWSTIEPHTGGYYANVQAEAIDVARNYGPDYARLSSIKKSFDPANLFRLNSNILPAA